MKVVLFQPQIPQNAGNVVRTCAVTGSDLILVRPLGFSITDRWLKRAGLDYWEGVNVSVIDDLVGYLKVSVSPLFFFSSKAKKIYSDQNYDSDAILIFGSETDGLPDIFHELWEDRFVTIPMIQGKRCLNLATGVGIAIYEGWRQQQWK